MSAQELLASSPLQQIISPWLVRSKDQTVLAQLCSLTRMGEKAVEGIKQLVDLINEGEGCSLWLDLWHANLPDATALHAIILSWKHLKDHNNHLIIVDPSELSHDLLKLVRFDVVLDIRPELFSLRSAQAHPVEAGLLKAIHREPGEMAHRWVLADWLEDQGDPRSEPVRLLSSFAELEIKRTGNYEPDETDLLMRFGP